MRLAGHQRRGTFLRRVNRFLVEVELEGDTVPVHLPNSGRLGELLVAGSSAVLTERNRANRRTAYDLSLLQSGGTWVSVDSRLPPRLVAEAIAAGRLPLFAGYADIRAEPVFGESRLDLLLTGGGADCYVEVKGVTLVVERQARFPDAVSLRGARHMRTLEEARAAGHRAAAVFVIQRPDADSLAPHEGDPAFGEALRRAEAAGVEVYAYRCRVSPEEVAIEREVPVWL